MCVYVNCGILDMFQPLTRLLRLGGEEGEQLVSGFSVLTSDVCMVRVPVPFFLG